MKIPTFLFVCLALLHASVLEATEWNQETALAELLTLSQSKERRAQARDWLERLEKAEVDLGKQGFVEAVARLFAGDAPGARETLVVYLRRYRTLPSSEYEPQLASLTLATTNRAVVTGSDHECCGTAFMPRWSGNGSRRGQKCPYSRQVRMGNTSTMTNLVRVDAVSTNVRQRQK